MDTQLSTVGKNIDKEEEEVNNAFLWESTYWTQNEFFDNNICYHENFLLKFGFKLCGMILHIL